MDFLNLARNRRSVRKFEDHEVGDDVIRKILDATFTAPSSKNLHTTRIAVIRNRETIAKIASMRPRGSSFVRGAAAVFIVMGDDSQTDLWRENCAISATVLQFAAESLGLGTCWVHVNDRTHDDGGADAISAAEYLREAIPELPGYKIMCLVAAGYPLEKPAPHEPRDYTDKVFIIG